MKLTFALTAVFTAMSVVPASLQSPPPTGQKLTLSSAMIGGYTVLRRDLLEAAELMPEADYLFKPTPETRPFGQLIAHVALSQFVTCSFLQGGPSPKAAEKEETPRSKAALIALLKESAAFCNPFVNAMTDEGMLQLIKAGPNEGARGVPVTLGSGKGRTPEESATRCRSTSYCGRRQTIVDGARPSPSTRMQAGR